MKVQITKCSKRGAWYQNSIGNIYELRTVQPETKEGAHLDNKFIIYRGDYEVWDDTNEILKLKKEIDILKQQLEIKEHNLKDYDDNYCD